MISRVILQIIFDGFTVGRYNEGTDDNNDFESVDTRTMMSAGGTEACKFSFSLIKSIYLTLFSPFFLTLKGPDGYMQVRIDENFFFSLETLIFFLFSKNS